MKLIGVVGKQGSGKSYFCKLLVECLTNSFNQKALHINVDKIGHETLTDENVKRSLKNFFGDIIFDEHGIVNRKKLSDIVFKDNEALEMLNKLTLPKLKEILSELLFNNFDKDFVILDYALLPLVSPFFENCHRKILVEASLDERKTRALSRDNITEEKFFEREKACLSYNPKDFDIVIQNTSDIDYDGLSLITKLAYVTCYNLINSHKKAAYYPGSFDPITYGHIDMIEKTLKIGFDKIIVAVTANASKKSSMFTLKERVNMIQELFKSNPKVEVIAVEPGKASVKVAEKLECSTMIRGLRNVTDFEYELNLSKVNSTLSNVETVFLTASHKYDFVSSSVTRELAYLNEDISSYVPPLIEKKIREKIVLSK